MKNIDNIVIVCNGSAGQNKSNLLSIEIKKYLEENGIESQKIQILKPKTIEECYETAYQASKNKTDIVVSLGGDGTINTLQLKKKINLVNLLF